ncbi:DGQHR domain-containing protein [Pseudomonas aeruginosa]|nr:DGQHR domain-containing protein [Pseudomonas aeruginosa]MBI7468809.1 DGQHR domain-containing protein [Pseudomonas aeruginosa]MBI8217100.1 DGQHR domain-containing protein [Pseudomonas aeruginosa]MDI3753777.1 DGQHR domain-containing protein [Pseudomonas aeruginosa]MDI3997516.1 DGQHR domain-containing protein [Pseudomonas aeruginosa]
MKKHDQLLLPALRGYIGDWVYYSCLMPVSELALRVDYATDIHQDRALSRLIQRSLEGERAEHIASYLERTPERFFNSLVLATYDGCPEWLEVGNFEATSDKKLIEAIGEQALDTLGFLSLSGDERIFAVDGQHRLAGIKRAIIDKTDFGKERISVIFISHSEDRRERTRRLFTTLNKTAKPVKKRDIIALDEDDTMAIIARRLIESNSWFASPKILIDASENIPSTNRVCLTTIANLYDVLKQIFKYRVGQKSDTGLRFYRPSDKELDKFYNYALRFFEALAEAFPAVRELFDSSTPARVTQKYRGEHGGHFLFRPAGLIAFTAVVIAYAKHHELSLPDAIRAISNIPVELTEPPFDGVIWDSGRGKMILTGKRLLVELLQYMVGLPVDVKKLQASYAKALGDRREVELPTKLIV